MKITNIETIEKGLCSIEATVSYEPNLIQRLFGYKSKKVVYVYEGTNYMFISGKVWFIKETGKEYGRIKEIDAHLRKLNFNK